ncbi:hypothetical protein ['Camptotheca acuminata' phytoplasma]|uniref:hypothetical protein n=1 Tax='Camptotheca acuminata' phytoplasma TaxID=3239192 RepID=UPI00351AA48E
MVIFLITGISGVISEQLTNVVGDILEENPDSLEAASKLISETEDCVMGVVDVVDDVPVVRNLVRVRSGLEFCKTVGKATSYPVNVFNEIGKNVLNGSNYKYIENPIYLVENVSKGTILAVEGLAKATVNTGKDIFYGAKDAWSKLFSW